jgi:transcriptional regulator GlxA family with amidase domain
MKKKVAIFVFPDVEVMDFAGPFEVFAVSGQRSGPGFFDVYTVAETRDLILARNGLQVMPHYGFRDCPQPDILLIPGGYGTRPLLHKPAVLDWIRHTGAQAELLLSVCTGSLLLAKAGLLDGLEATTHFAALDLLRELAPNSTIFDTGQFRDNGRIVTSAGVSAGIDMAFHIVERLHGREAALEAAKWIEYPWPRA